jgi:hypothetical protein
VQLRNEEGVLLNPAITSRAWLQRPLTRRQGSGAHACCLCAACVPTGKLLYTAIGQLLQQHPERMKRTPASMAAAMGMPSAAPALPPPPSAAGGASGSGSSKKKKGKK